MDVFDRHYAKLAKQKEDNKRRKEMKKKRNQKRINKLAKQKYWADMALKRFGK